MLICTTLRHLLFEKKSQNSSHQFSIFFSLLRDSLLNFVSLSWLVVEFMHSKLVDTVKCHSKTSAQCQLNHFLIQLSELLGVALDVINVKSKIRQG